MPDTILAWLDAVGSTAFTLSAVAFVTLNALAIAAVLMTRDQRIVNRFTPHFLAVNLLLLGTGLGVPLAALAARSVISIVTPTFHHSDAADLPLRPDVDPSQMNR